MTEKPLTDTSENDSRSLAQADSRNRHDAHQVCLSLVDELPVYALCKDLEGQYTFVSQRHARKLGTTPENAIGKSDFDFYSKQQAERFREEDRRVIATEELLVSTEEDNFGDTTKYFSLRKGPIHAEDGSVVGVQTIFWDITEQKVLEKAFQDERDLLQTIMNQLPDFIYVKDKVGRYVVVNDGVRQILGANSVAEVIGKTNYDYLPPEQAKLERIDDDHVIKLDQPLIEREERMQDNDGNELWILTSKLPLRDRTGEISGLVGIDRNITRLKAIEAQLRSAKDAADHANRAKSDFLANMSHEIRTPMNAIIGMTDLLLETQLTPTQRDYLGMVQDSGESLLSLINDILDFSKIESGKFELEITSFDIRDTLGDAMKSLGLRAYKKGLELAVNVDQEIPVFLKGDPGRLRQIIVNLVGNAIKFTDDGEVVLEISCQSKTVDEVSLLFAVSDTGMGIAADQCDKIFQEFEQADPSTTRRFGGTGLGLAISSRLVALMGGRIWVESELGCGSKFQFAAPLQIDHKRKNPVVDQPVDVQGLRVLVVDDNATNRRILKEMLTNWGMSPVTASGAEQAIQLLLDAVDEQDPITLAISDVNMPGIDGIGLARQITEHELLAKTSIIMLTSGARPDDARQLRAIGIDFHLMKPIKQSELFSAMVSTIGQQDLAQGTPMEVDSQSEPAEQARPLSVLLAEDNYVNQRLALGILKGLGHEVSVANNGIEAVNSILNRADTARKFDLVLMDVQMPELDGHAATREIRNHEASFGGHVPIVAMTAHAMKGDREACLDAGMDDYLTKPIRLQEMADKFREMFPSGGALKEPEPESEPAEETTSSLIDWDLAIKNVGGNQTLFFDVVVAFLEDTPRLLTLAEDAAELGDSVALCATAHSLRGSLMFLHANDAYESARRLETLGVEGGIEQARGELQTLKSMYTQIRVLLDAYVAEHQPT